MAGAGNFGYGDSSFANCEIGTMIPTAPVDFAVGNSSFANCEIGTMIPTTPGDARSLPFPPFPIIDSTVTPSQSVANYVSWTKLWEGSVVGQRNVIPIPIYKVQMYRQTSTPNTLAADWPSTMQVTQSIPQTFVEHHCMRREFRRQIEVVELHPFSSNDFFGELAQKRHCVVIQLPTHQTLLLPCWQKKVTKMLGYLFPEDYLYDWHFILQSLKKVPINLTSSPLEPGGQARYFHWLRTRSTIEDMSKRNRLTGQAKRLKLGLKERFVTTVETPSQELLPGLPNEVTLYQIASKLPWRALHLLSSVSRDWRKAIRSRQVYEARVHHRLTEQLVVCNHTFQFSKKAKKLEVSQISLYSTKDGRFYDVPSLPHLGGIPKGCQTVSLNGKLYVLGGLKDKTSNLGSKEVYVLDLAGQTRGQRRWIRCGDMRLPRQEFACGVTGEKIYVFGGTSVLEPVCESEVYDPRLDAWSPLSSMLSSRFRHSVATVGEELVLHGGCSYEAKYMDWRERRLIVDLNRFVVDLDGKKLCTLDHALDNYGGDDRMYISQNGKIIDQDGEWIGDLSNYYTDASSLEVYHPAKDEWRVVKPFQTESNAKVFVAHGKYYSMSRHGIQVYDIGKASWTHLHSCSFAAIGPVYDVDPTAVIAMNDELLLAVVRYSKRGVLTKGSSLLRSKGFGSKLKEIVWEEASHVQLSFGSTLNHTPFVVPIQL